MADEEHLKILDQGIAAWNKWRDENPDITPDISEAKLPQAFLMEADLMKSNFYKADLNQAQLGRAKLILADLSYADLSCAGLLHANLHGANLSGADLQEAELFGANLNEAVLSKANITGALLYGTARDNWKIDGIKCDYVYWGHLWDIREPQEGNFEPGEFEKLYKELPKIKYTFRDDFTVIDIIVMDQIVQELNILHPGHELKLDSFHHRGRPRAVFTIRDREQADVILDKIRDMYESQMRVIQSDPETYKKAFATALKEPQTVVNIKRLEMSRDNYKIQGLVGAVGPHAHGHDINYNQLWNQISNDNDLPKLAEELSQLCQALNNEAKKPEHYRAIAEVADAEKAAKDKNAAKALKHLKKAGKWAFNVAEKIGTGLATAALKVTLDL